MRSTCDKVIIYFLTRWKEFRNVTRAEKFKTSKLTKFMKLVGRCMDETIRKNLYLFADFSFITGISRNPARGIEWHSSTPYTRYFAVPENWVNYRHMSNSRTRNRVLLPLSLYILPSGNRKKTYSNVWASYESQLNFSMVLYNHIWDICVALFDRLKINFTLPF